MIAALVRTVFAQPDNDAAVNDDMIAADRRYIAAASVAGITDQPIELALPAAPRT